MSKDKDTGLSALASGFRKRTLVTAKLASKMGMSYAKKMTGLGGAVDKETAMRAAEALVRDMDSLKGLVLKMGQMASYLPGALPPEAQRVLARLQSQTTALDFAAVEQVFARSNLANRSTSSSTTSPAHRSRPPPSGRFTGRSSRGGLLPSRSSTPASPRRWRPT